MGHPDGMAPRTLAGRRVVSAWRRLHREEEGVALVLAIVSMLVLTLTLTAVMFMTAAGARDAHRTNAGQRAYSLAESGVNNALAVLEANYPGSFGYPGDNRLLTTCPASLPTVCPFDEHLPDWIGEVVRHARQLASRRRLGRPVEHRLDRHGLESHRLRRSASHANGEGCRPGDQAAGDADRAEQPAQLHLRERRSTSRRA